jgi:NCAIR mutase (PurE)-related protein
MDESRLRQLLDEVASGQLNVQSALDRLRGMPFEDLGFAKVDHHRALRTGFPEVIFCPGKTPDQVTRIVEAMREQEQVVLATHASTEIYQAVQAVTSEAVYHEDAQIVQVGQPEATDCESGSVLVVSAGTSDIPVAEEARVTAVAAGCEVQSLYDVGVAGLHRLLGHREMLEQAAVIVVVAGMEGALPSVIGGLVSAPVIAVPTSIGYGASFGGVAALLAMLNSCASGVVVVNIDNGFGAGYFAAMLAKNWRTQD